MQAIIDCLGFGGIDETGSGLNADYENFEVDGPDKTK